MTATENQCANSLTHLSHQLNCVLLLHLPFNFPICDPSAHAKAFRKRQFTEKSSFSKCTIWSCLFSSFAGGDLCEAEPGSSAQIDSMEWTDVRSNHNAMGLQLSCNCWRNCVNFMLVTKLLSSIVCSWQTVCLWTFGKVLSRPNCGDMRETQNNTTWTEHAYVHCCVAIQ